MTEPKRVPLTATTSAHEIFGSLWGVIVLSAVRKETHRPLTALTVNEFVSRKRSEIDGTLAKIEAAAVLDRESMSIFEGSWDDDADIAPMLMLYAGYLDEAARLDDEAALPRFVRYGLDCQLADLADGLVRAVVDRSADLRTGVASAIDALRSAAALSGEASPDELARMALRIWKVSHLRRLLRPDSRATPATRTELRTAARLVDEWLAAQGA
jgi:hypothetical protein